MKSQTSIPVGKSARKFSDGVLANRYLDLQRLRDEVQKAETGCAPRRLKKPRDRKLEIRAILERA
jgi:hypothetical protein